MATNSRGGGKGGGRKQYNTRGRDKDRNEQSHGRSSSSSNERLDYVPPGTTRPKTQTFIDDHAVFDGEKKYESHMTPENYSLINEHIRAGQRFVTQITDGFHKEGQLYPPMFLHQMFGTYFVRSLYYVDWTQEVNAFWINDSKNGIAKWTVSGAQLKLRYAMLKKFSEVMQDWLRQDDKYQNIEVLYSDEVKWPDKNRLSFVHPEN